MNPLWAGAASSSGERVVGGGEGVNRFGDSEPDFFIISARLIRVTFIINVQFVAECSRTKCSVYCSRRRFESVVSVRGSRSAFPSVTLESHKTATPNADPTPSHPREYTHKHVLCFDNDITSVGYKPSRRRRRTFTWNPFLDLGMTSAFSCSPWPWTFAITFG